MMHRRIVICISLGLLLLASSCARHGRVLSQKKMIDVLSDIQLAQAVYGNPNSGFDSYQKKDDLVQGVFRKHDITQSDLDSSLAFYSDRIIIYNKINDEVKNRLQGMAHVLMSKKLWMDSTFNKQYMVLPPMCWLTAFQPVLRFRVDSSLLKSDASIKKRLQFSFNVCGKSPYDSLNLGFYFVYKDTTVLIKKRIVGDRYFCIERPHRPDSLLKWVSGYFRLVPLHFCGAFQSECLLYNIHYRLKGSVLPLSKKMKKSGSESKSVKKKVSRKKGFNLQK